MLNVLRHKGVAKKVLWFITIVIVLSFGFFGVANRLDNSINSAGKMYGKNVTMKDFERAYYDTRDQAIMLYGDRFFKVGSRLNLEQETWDRMMLLKEARKQNITVSDDELAAFIAAIPFFQTNGTFDKFKYESIVRNPSVFDRELRDFEEGVRSQLMIKKLMDRLTGPVSLTDDELKKEYQVRNQKIKLDYVLFSPANYTKNIKVTDDEVKKFYDERKEQFRLPTMINVSYVHIATPAKATDADKDKARKQAYELAAELKPGSDFAAIAKKHNLELKTSGLFSQDQPILTFASNPDDLEKLFGMKINEYTKPLEVPDGWLLGQIKEHKASAVPSWDEAKDRAKEALIDQKAFELAKVNADKVLKSIADGIKTKPFKDTAKALNLKVDETPLFSRGEYIANMGLVQEFQQEAASLNKDNKLSTVVATSQGPAILYLDTVAPADEEQFKTDKDSFRDQISAERRNQIMITFMSKLRLAANVQSKVKYQK